VPRRQGNSHPSLVPYQDFPTKDGAMLLAIGNDGQFARFCEAASHAALAQDTRYATNPQRVQHRDTLVPLLTEITRTRTTAEWIAVLEHKAVPCGPINDIAQAFADEQVRARGLVVEQARSARGRAAEGVPSIRGVASPLRMGATPPVLRRAPPALGEHTDEVLAELGLDAAAITSLRSKGIL
jgi:formyl-CoA transferase